MTRTIAVANQKGGVGKTTISTGIADAAAAAGRKVLLVDLDPQANATRILGIDTSELPTMADLMLAEDGDHHIGEIAVPTGWGVDLAPSEDALATRDLQRGIGDEMILRQALTGGAQPYDLVLIDCPPHLGLLTINALTAADAVLLVADPAVDALAGLSRLLDRVTSIRRRLNPGLAIAGVVVNKADRTRVGEARLGEIRAAFGADVWGVVPQRAGLREALEHGTPPHTVRGIPEVTDVLAELARRT